MENGRLRHTGPDGYMLSEEPYTKMRIQTMGGRAALTGTISEAGEEVHEADNEQPTGPNSSSDADD